MNDWVKIHSKGEKPVMDNEIYKEWLNTRLPKDLSNAFKKKPPPMPDLSIRVNDSKDSIVNKSDLFIIPEERNKSISNPEPFNKELPPKPDLSIQVNDTQDSIDNKKDLFIIPEEINKSISNPELAITKDIVETNDMSMSNNQSDLDETYYDLSKITKQTITTDDQGNKTRKITYENGIE